MHTVDPYVNSTDGGSQGSAKVSVTWEDQQNINKFSNLYSRLGDVEQQLKEQKVCNSVNCAADLARLRKHNCSCSSNNSQRGAFDRHTMIPSVVLTLFCTSARPCVLVVQSTHICSHLHPRCPAVACPLLYSFTPCTLLMLLVLPLMSSPRRSDPLHLCLQPAFNRNRSF